MLLGTQRTILADDNPFFDDEAYYINACFYKTKNDQEKVKWVAEDEDIPILSKPPLVDFTKLVT